MKRVLFLSLLSIIFTLQSFAQGNPNKLGCKDKDLLVQASEQKVSLKAQGFNIENDAMLRMKSREEFPVLIHLEAGVFYHFLFLGNTRAKKMQLQIIDPNQKFIIEKKQLPYKNSSNTISFSFTPAQSGTYSILLFQNMKQELFTFKDAPEVCGSFTIFKLKK